MGHLRLIRGDGRPPSKPLRTFARGTLFAAGMGVVFGLMGWATPGGWAAWRVGLILFSIFEFFALIAAAMEK